MMATVDMNFVQIYRPPLDPPSRWQKQIALSYNSRSVRAERSLSQAALPRNKLGQILESSSLFKPEIVAALDKRHNIESQVERSVLGRAQASSNHSPINHCNESDNDLSLKELSQSTWPPNTLTKASKTEQSLLQPNKLALDATSMPIDYTEPRLSSRQGDNQRSQDLPIIIEDNEPDSINDSKEAKAASDNIDAIRAQCDANISSTLPNQDPAFELGIPIGLSALERWYDVEAGCYIDEELPLGLGPKEQQGSAVSTSAHSYHHYLYRSSHHQFGQHDNNNNTQRTLAELLNEGGKGGSDEDVSGFERDMLPAFEEQERSSLATAPSSPQPPRLYTKQSRAQMDQEHEQGKISHSRSEELGLCSPPCNQNKDEEELQEQRRRRQQQEVAAEAMREEGNTNNGEWEQSREKQRHQDEAKESSSIHHSRSCGDSHNTSSEDDEDPQRAKRQKLSSAPAYESLTPQPQTLTPPPATQLEVTSRCDNQPKSWVSSSPPPIGDEEPSPNVGAAYQEWPVRGFFKLITIGNEVRYGMEFSLEDVQQLCATAFPLHTSSVGCSASFSDRPDRPAQPAQPFTACTRTKNTMSRSKRPRFTEEEDAKLVDLKERRRWSWEDIQRSFPERSTGSLQVRYSTKLKERTTAS